jgi:spore coat polysaccharide biosynthesis protein SpsF
MIVAIVQARMSATRLPGKVLKEIGGTSILEFQVDRIRRSGLVEEVVVATSCEPQDQEIVEYCKFHGINWFVGSENDVLSRYHDCAVERSASTIVRLTADCPFIDPVVIDRVVSLRQTTGADFAANTVPPETSDWPDGSDVEVFSMQALSEAHREAKTYADREHVTFFFWKNIDRDRFRTVQLSNTEDWSKYRFVLDYPEDYEVVVKIFSELRRRGQFGYAHEVIQVLEDHPKIPALNAKYYFGIGWQ